MFSVNPFRVLVCAVLLVLGSAAPPQAEERKFTEENGNAYLKAEAFLFVEQAPDSALAVIDDVLRHNTLNAYERSVFLRLAAAAHMKLGQYDRAVARYETLIDQPNKTDFSVLICMHGSIGDILAIDRLHDRWEVFGGSKDDLPGYDCTSRFAKNASNMDSRPVPLNPPNVRTIPKSAFDAPVECLVKFDVDISGSTKFPEAKCSDSTFELEAQLIVDQLEYSPRIVRGQVMPRENMEYTLIFELNE